MAGGVLSRLASTAAAAGAPASRRWAASAAAATATAGARLAATPPPAATATGAVGAAAPRKKNAGITGAIRSALGDAAAPLPPGYAVDEQFLHEVRRGSGLLSVAVSMRLVAYPSF